ncbi:GNAT family N-acetyltransferase [archaeon]|nr:GNAT family N-acetyltransferase [archaeon]
MSILDYLGKYTKNGLIFQQENITPAINELLELSYQAYLKRLHKTVVREMALLDEAGNPLSTEVIRAIEQGNIPSKKDLLIRSKDFEDNVDQGFVAVRNLEGRLIGACVNAKPIEGYHYHSAGKDEHGDPTIKIDYNWPDQAHIWELAFIDDYRNQGLGTFTTLAAIRLSHEKEGAKNISTYASAYAKQLASTKFAQQAARYGLKQHHKFPMLDENNQIINHGRLYRLKLTRTVLRGLRTPERTICEKLFE